MNYIEKKYAIYYKNSSKCIGCNEVDVFSHNYHDIVYIISLCIFLFITTPF